MPDKDEKEKTGKCLMNKVKEGDKRYMTKRIKEKEKRMLEGVRGMPYKEEENGREKMPDK